MDFNPVETTHNNLTSIVTQIMACEPSLYNAKHNILAALPFYHVYGVVAFNFWARTSSVFFCSCLIEQF